MRIKLTHSYSDIVCLENLFAAWREFVLGKSKKADVQKFALKLADNIVELNRDLENRTYEHGKYFSFSITDPKPRRIHKSTVRDRVLHHAVYRLLYPFFNKTFTPDSFSCRNAKGTHKAMDRFRKFAYMVSKNHTRTAWVLKCDIKKFFASINHEVLLNILGSYISDPDIIELMAKIIKSFPGPPGKGLPLGNLTSQLFCNMYMNELDQFVKHKLGIKCYIRYADDFVLLSHDRQNLVDLIPVISEFLSDRLKLSLHPHKVSIESLASGVDFLGWVHFPTHRVVRKSTERRAFRRIKEHPTNETLQSYLGLLSHGDAYNLKQRVLNNYGLWKESAELDAGQV